MELCALLTSITQVESFQELRNSAANFYSSINHYLTAKVWKYDFKLHDAFKDELLNKIFENREEKQPNHLNQEKTI